MNIYIVDWDVKNQNKQTLLYYISVPEVVYIIKTVQTLMMPHTVSPLFAIVPNHGFQVKKGLIRSKPLPCWAFNVLKLHPI